MFLALLLGYLLISVVFGLIAGTAIRMQGSGACDRPSPAPAPRPAVARTGGRPQLGMRVATGG